MTWDIERYRKKQWQIDYEPGFKCIVLRNLYIVKEWTDRISKNYQVIIGYLCRMNYLGTDDN